MTRGIDLDDLMPSDAEEGTRLTTEAVLAAWNRALEHRHSDPERSIASAHALLKTVCRHVLDRRGVTHSDSLDLPVLMKMTAEQLDLAPTQRSATVSKRLFAGAASVVDGLSSLPNVIGDFREYGWPDKRTARHAQLAVNMAGAVALFLVQAWEARVEDDLLEIIDDSKGG